jgi:hypothetical protein
VHVEVVEETGAERPAAAFPPGENYVDLRANPQAIAQIAAARRYLPLRNFLTEVNGPESIFATSNAATKSDLPGAIYGGSAYEFASQAVIVFAAPSFNWDRSHYVDLCSGLKELLERDPSDAVRAVLKISSCEFAAEQRRGFSLGIRLVAEGSSAQQAELRWGLALARVQQALLFRSRTLKQQIAE